MSQVFLKTATRSLTNFGDSHYFDIGMNIQAQFIVRLLKAMFPAAEFTDMSYSTYNNYGKWKSPLETGADHQVISSRRRTIDV
jgi:hypothetical protein